LLISLLLGLGAIAPGQTPSAVWFTGTNYHVTVNGATLSIGNDVISLVLDQTSGLKATSLKFGLTEFLTAPSSEGSITTPSGTVDLGDPNLVADYSQVTATAQVGTEDVSVQVPITDNLARVPNFTVCYRIYRGNRPWITKWFDFPSATQIDRIYLINWRISANYIQGDLGDWGDAGKVFAGNGYWIALVPNEMKGTPPSVDPHNLLMGEAQRNSNGIYCYLNLDKSFQGKTKECLITLGRGNKFTGSDSVKIYWTSYCAHASGLNRPVIYNTWYTYKQQINESICMAEALRAKQRGCDYFVVDDGWQNGNRYGEWTVDPVKFPNGLKPLADYVHSLGMKFGVWVAPCFTHRNASTYDPSRVIKNYDGSIYGGSNLAYNCLAIDSWRQFITGVLVNFVQNVGVDFFKLDFGIEHPCYDASHGHSLVVSELAQHQGWEQLCADVRAANPNVILYRAYGSVGETAVNDMSWQTDPLWGNFATRYDPYYALRSADTTRFGTGYKHYLAPPFTQTGTTMISLPGLLSGYSLDERLNALNYNLATIVGSYDNYEESFETTTSIPQETALRKWWVNFYRQNQQYLMWSQYDNVAKRCYDAFDGGYFNPFDSKYQTQWVDGRYALRPPIGGKYGYLFFWNPSPVGKVVSLDVDLADHFLPSPTTKLAMVELLPNGNLFRRAFVSAQVGHLKANLPIPAFSCQAYAVIDPIRTDSRQTATASELPPNLVFQNIFWP